MVLFYAGIRRDSDLVLYWYGIGIDSDSHFRSHIQVFPCEICRLKNPYSCFPSHFCFLVIVDLLILFVEFLVEVISLFLFFSMSSSRRIDAPTLSSMLMRPLALSFLDTYCLSISSLSCQGVKTSYLQFPKFLFQAFGNLFKGTNYNSYQRQLHAAFSLL